MMVILMLLLSMAGMTAMQVGRDARIRAGQNSHQIAARYAAHAAVEKTVYIMNQTLASGHWSETALPQFADASLPGSPAVYSTTVSGSLSSGYRITATGNVQDTEHTVRAVVALKNPFAMNFAVYSRNGIDLKNDSSVRGFDSRDITLAELNADIGTTSSDRGMIDLKNRSEVYGDIYVGPNVDPADVVTFRNRSDIQGELFSHPFPPPLPEITTPQLSYKGQLSGSELTLTEQDSGVYDSIDIGNSGTLRIEGHCVVVITGNVDLKNSAEISIADGGSLRLYLAGNFNANNSAGVFNENAVPSYFQLYGTGDNQRINLRNSSDFYGVVYAPNADMSLDNSGNAYGSFIVGDFDLKNSGHLYYDQALKTVSPTDEAVRFEIVQWEEL